MLVDFVALMVALTGIAVGALLAFVFFRVRSHELVQSAVAHGRVDLEVELAAQAERLRSLEAQSLSLRQDRINIQAQEENLRIQLEAATSDKARLAERAARVQDLEAEVARLALELRLSEQELRRISVLEAHRSRDLQATRAELEALRAEGHVLERALAPIRVALGLPAPALPLPGLPNGHGHGLGHGAEVSAAAASAPRPPQSAG